jgi:hypothetical protein
LQRFIARYWGLYLKLALIALAIPLTATAPPPLPLLKIKINVAADIQEYLGFAKLQLQHHPLHLHLQSNPALLPLQQQSLRREKNSPSALRMLRSTVSLVPSGYPSINPLGILEMSLDLSINLGMMLKSDFHLPTLKFMKWALPTWVILSYMDY